MSIATAMARIGSKYSQPVSSHEQQAEGDAERRVDVGEEVGGVGLERGRVGAPRDRREDLARDDEVGDSRDAA